MGRDLERVEWTVKHDIFILGKVSDEPSLKVLSVPNFDSISICLVLMLPTHPVDKEADGNID